MNRLLPLVLLACAPTEGPRVSTPTEPVLDEVDRPATTMVEHVVEAPCDAGDAVWVRRTLPLLWGRQAHGAHEVELWADIAATWGRDVAVRAMAHDPAYLEAWSTWLMDDLGVDRDGYRRAKDCFDDPALDTHDGTLTTWLTTADPDEAYGDNFTMADVLRDALVADDLSVVYRTWLLGRMARPPIPCPNATDVENELDRRRDFGETFFATWLGRDLECLACHNNEYSITDHPDPWLDRSWALPGYLSEAMLGSSFGAPEDEVYSAFRQLVGGPASPSPWGWDAACGQLNRVDPSEPDLAGQDTTWFIDDLGPTGSAWDLQQQLADGVDLLDGQGLLVGPDGAVDGRAAFAYALGATLADDVWSTATGSSLVLSHGLSRNAAQRDQLQRLTDPFVAERFSLQTLLVAVTTDPSYNAGAPGTCASGAYPMPPLWDPFSVESTDPNAWGNGVGDRLRTHRARTLLRTIDHAMGWVPADEWGLDEDTRALWVVLGAYLSEQDRGFQGTSFQALLELESHYRVCQGPVGTTDDQLDQWLGEAIDAQLPVQAVVEALKDRLTGDGVVDPAEQPLLEDLVGHSLDTVVASLDDDALDDLDEGLRALCSVLLQSPRLQLAGDLGGVGVVPELAVGMSEDCDAAVAALQAVGVTASCDAGRVR